MLTRRGLCISLAASLAPRMAFGHGLPGSTITLTLYSARIGLTLSVPLDELALAMATPLALSPGPVPAATADDMARYLAAHAALTVAGNPAPLVPEPAGLTISTATHEHVGSYPLLQARLAADVAPALPLTLFYDAVMHEVRNHTATVFLQSGEQEPLPMGEIRANPDGGPPRPFVLTAWP